jgi:hypothetical protein
MNTNRANPFADIENLPTFEPKPKTTPKANKEQIGELADASGFPSRQPVRAKAAHRPPGRRYKTGRNQQINIKATADVIGRLYKLADERHVPLGELLELALNALESSSEGTSTSTLRGK